MGPEPVEPGGARLVMRDMPADRRRRCDDDVAWLRHRHEGVEIGEGTGANANLGMAGTEQLGRELGRDHLDPLDGLEPHLVLVAR